MADAQEIAKAVWNHPVRNTFGDVVQARLAALEQRLTPTDNP